MDGHHISRINLDEAGRATKITIFSLRRPHMRALHFAWLSFLAAFTGWFAISPLIPTIKKDLNLSANDIANANITSVAGTIVARIIVGPMCDRWGPKRVMAGILLLGAIPTGLAGLVSNGTGLIILRFFIGILGATFVPCQFWATQMFAPNVVGTANAIAAGWGNMGGGLTYLIMPLIFNALNLRLSAHDAWRVAYVVPAVIIAVIGILDLLITDDCPEGDWSDKKAQYAARHAQKIKDDAATTTTTATTTMLTSKLNTDPSVEASSILTDDEILMEKPLDSTWDSVVAVCRQLGNLNVWILMLQYALSFGLELSIDNVIGSFFAARYGLDQTTAALYGSIFGLMNIFSRASGGLISDAMAKMTSFPIHGRILAQVIIMSLEGIFLITFSRITATLGGAIAGLVLFSFFTQATCGTTFGILPFVTPQTMGVGAGLVGAGGNIGGLVLNYVFKVYGGNMEGAFLMIGCVTLGVAFLSLALKTQGKMWGIFRTKGNN